MSAITTTEKQPITINVYGNIVLKQNDGGTYELERIEFDDPNTVPDFLKVKDEWLEVAEWEEWFKTLSPEEQKLANMEAISTDKTPVVPANINVKGNDNVIWLFP